VRRQAFADDMRLTTLVLLDRIEDPSNREASAPAGLDRTEEGAHVQRRSERRRAPMTNPAEGILDLPASPRSVPVARRLARRAGEAAGLPVDVSDVLQLLVSELVTNAVVHARTEIRLHVVVTAEQIRIEVCDQAGLQPRLRTHSVSATTGRGLRMLNVLASSWGVDELADGGKMVWATLPVDGLPSDQTLAERYDDLAGLLGGVGPRDEGRSA
jgi:anti-sigma regulatory factor (Ser/Thr protein kinase)